MYESPSPPAVVPPPLVKGRLQPGVLGAAAGEVEEEGASHRGAPGRTPRVL